MKKIISIILGIMLMFAMSVNSFAVNINDEITPNPETIVFEIGCVKAVPAKDADGKNLDDMIYTFRTRVSNKTKSNINISDYPVALIFINDKTYETIDAANFNLADKWINANYQKTWADLNNDNDAVAPSDIVENVVRMNYDEATTVDIKVMIAGKTADVKTAMITTVTPNEYPVTITLDVTPKATPDAPTTETTTDAPTTEAPTTSKPADTTTEAPTTEAPVDTTVPTARPSAPTTNAPADVDPEIPDTGATVPFAAIGTLVTSAITALVAKKKKEN
jgi:hypothetical protein